MLKTLGRYEIGACIGKGAMADVYSAHDPSIDRVLAIKVLKPEFRQSRQYAARFIREAKAAGALSHPNIVTIYDVGEEAGYPYIAMELLEGEPLDSITRRGGRLSPAEVAAIGVQLAEALSYAHGLGVVHRDIKPSNIMLGKDGWSIKLLDFGIAWVEDVADPDDEEAALRTQVGQVLGTPRYMSPEQALGREADGRADLFSVGVVLYELVTGRRAFNSSNPAALGVQIIQADPEPISKFAPDCPSGLQFIIGKLLNKQPAKRFANGAQLAAALRRELRDTAANAGGRRALPLPVRMALVMGSITAMVLLLSVGAVLQRQDQALERMAITSGAAITSFIASNAAFTAADNAALPADQQDWLPVEAFVKTALGDPNIQQITVVDNSGVIRASTQADRIGRAYRPVKGEAVVSRRDALTITDAHAPGAEAALRFVRPITYAGRTFGRVDVSVNKADLTAASSLSRVLLGFLAVVTLGAVIAVSYAAARAIASPLGRLKAALADAAAGDLDFRISHARRDEFGELFDGFNHLAAALQARLEAAAKPSPPLKSPGAPEPSSGPFAPGVRPLSLTLGARVTLATDVDDRTQISEGGAARGSPAPAAEPTPDPLAAPLFQRLRQFRQA